MPESLLPALADVLDETLDDLRAETDPRRAVIAAYARMERALAAYGLPRSPAEAPDEYLQRIFADLDVSRRATSRLTALFAWAKFSGHDVAPEMKQEAIEALEAVREELRAAEILAEQQRAGSRSRSSASGRRADEPRAARGRARCCSRRSGSASRSCSLPIARRWRSTSGSSSSSGSRCSRSSASCAPPTRPTPSAFVASLRQPPRRRRAPRRSLARLEREVSMAGLAGVRRPLPPSPRPAELAAELLSSRRGIDLEREPDRAHAVLGDDVWELVRPDRPQPTDSADGAGIDEADLERVVAALERV